jgi:hypothetical protein
MDKKKGQIVDVRKGFGKIGLGIVEARDNVKGHDHRSEKED